VSDKNDEKDNQQPSPLSRNFKDVFLKEAANGLPGQSVASTRLLDESKTDFAADFLPSLPGALSAKIKCFLLPEAEKSGGHSSTVDAAILLDNESAILLQHVTSPNYKKVMFAYHDALSAFQKRLVKEPGAEKAEFKFFHYVVLFDQSVSLKPQKI
jgi:hypothetical protein